MVLTNAPTAPAVMPALVALPTVDLGSKTSDVLGSGSVGADISVRDWGRESRKEETEAGYSRDILLFLPFDGGESGLLWMT
jgi:hypothetical protein